LEQFSCLKQTASGIIRLKSVMKGTQAHRHKVLVGTVIQTYNQTAWYSFNFLA